MGWKDLGYFWLGFKCACAIPLSRLELPQSDGSFAEVTYLARFNYFKAFYILIIFVGAS